MLEVVITAFITTLVVNTVAANSEEEAYEIAEEMYMNDEIDLNLIEHEIYSIGE